ncbi:type II secretion system minor pseudopilin GspK [Collimonas pratensis]|uniref:type II secretion system minor pseudopilin GspK n=1 Tax=Collimonas pratensis TaxID=279113 RepID=UPI00143CC8A8|nr:type II secretion system minor pseudopilin GspK [Collimonas pratensis]NKI71524.1 type II secretion system minor pseudopilin GspK [Collimonas pratensis]
MKRQFRSRCAQRGVAVVTALLLTTLAVTIVASLFWQQQVQVRSIENQRLQLQKNWIMRGALDWASMILRASGKQFRYADLSQPWAAPLADTRLDQYVEDGQAVGDAGDAILSGHIVDAQSRYNLNNLSVGGKPSPDEVAAFKRLLSYLRLPGTLATAAAQAIAQGLPAAPSTTPPTTPPTGQQGNAATTASSTLPMMQVDDLLSVPGFTPDIVRQLQDYVVVLPWTGGPTPINANTASAEVLASRIPNLTLAQANTLVAMRRAAPFTDINNFTAQLTTLFNISTLPANAYLEVTSKNFLVYGKIRMGRAALNTVSLLNRADNGASTNIVWIREQ